MMKKQLAFLAFSMAALPVLAAGGGHGDGVPVNAIIFQAINLSVIVVGLFVVLRKPAKQFFADKNKSYVEAAEKTQAVRKQAEEEHRQIQDKLLHLEKTTGESIARAKAEAADYKKQLIAEAESLSKRISAEAAATANIEVEKAKNMLRAQMISEAVSVARGKMANDVSASDHQRLQGDFINNIQAAQK